MDWARSGRLLGTRINILGIRAVWLGAGGGHRLDSDPVVQIGSVMGGKGRVAAVAHSQGSLLARIPLAARSQVRGEMGILGRPRRSWREEKRPSEGEPRLWIAGSIFGCERTGADGADSHAG